MSGFQDRSLLNYHDLWLYGGLFELIAWPFSKITSLDEFSSRHFLNAAIGLLGIMGTFKLGTAIMGAGAGFWSALLLAMCPTYLGHMFNNPKDIPFAVGYVWSLYYIVLDCRAWPGARLGLGVKLSAAIGLCMAIRVGGVMLIGIQAIGLFLAVARQYRLRSGGKRLPALAASAIGRLALIGGLSYLIMLLFWPYGLLNPVSGPWHALGHFSKFPWVGRILFDGRLIDAAELPWDYIPRLLVLKLPEIFHAALLGGLLMVISGPSGLWQGGLRRLLRPISDGYILIFAAGALPVAYAIIADSVLYNGMRHFIFVIPPIACLAGCSIARGIRLSIGRQVLWLGLIAAIGIYILAHGAIIAVLHPHEIAYFNRFTGGIKGAFNKYELDYWGNAYKELTDKFKGEWRREGKGNLNPCRIAIMGPFDSAGHYLPEVCRMVNLGKGPDFIFFLTNAGPAALSGKVFLFLPTNAGPMALSGRVYAVVQRFGVPLACALDVRRRP